MPVPVLVNGFPKSGTHALLKAAQGLTKNDVMHGHWPDGELPKSDVHLLIVRDPRAIIISMLRMLGGKIDESTFLDMFRKFRTESLRKELAGYEPHLTSATCVVRYESLCDRTSVANRRADVVKIAKALENDDVFAIDEVALTLPGLTKTYNRIPSDFASVWTDRVQHAWTHEGGMDLLARWGYSL